MSEQNQTNWFKNLTNHVNTLAETFELDERQTNDFREFVVTIARDQYKVGTKSGAAWAFKQKGKEVAQTAS